MIPPHTRESVTGAIREVWSTLLDLETLADGQHFFETGGNSLLASIAVGALSDLFELELNVGALYANPTMSQLATHILELLAQMDSPTRMKPKDSTRAPPTNST